jgi:hypothetical protein
MELLLSLVIDRRCYNEIVMKRRLRSAWRSFWHVPRVEPNSAMYDSHKEEWSFRDMLIVFIIIVGGSAFLGWLIHHVIW